MPIFHRHGLYPPFGGFLAVIARIWSYATYISIAATLLAVAVLTLRRDALIYADGIIVKYLGKVIVQCEGSPMKISLYYTTDKFGKSMGIFAKVYTLFTVILSLA